MYCLASNLECSMPTISQGSSGSIDGIISFAVVDGGLLESPGDSVHPKLPWCEYGSRGSVGVPLSFSVEYRRLLKSHWGRCLLNVTYVGVQKRPDFCPRMNHIVLFISAVIQIA